jgi:hypothetical protein
LQKLDGLNSQDYTKITMITLWLIELFANELAVLKNYKQEKSEEYITLQESFKQFLSTPIIQVHFYLFINNYIQWMPLRRLTLGPLSECISPFTR